MATNLLEEIQKNLGYPELIKIDPNTQQEKEDISKDTRNFGQAAIPAVLIGLYKFGNTKTGSEIILRGNKSTTWVDEFFGDKTDEALGKVSSYTGDSMDTARSKMEDIAEEAIRVIRKNTPDNSSFTDVKSYVAEQRTNILLYLPAEIQMSTVVEDDTLDDRTNKMEGPMSNSMHFFEKLFSGSTTEKNEVKDDR